MYADANTMFYNIVYFILFILKLSSLYTQCIFICATFLCIFIYKKNIRTDTLYV